MNALPLSPPCRCVAAGPSQLRLTDKLADALGVPPAQVELMACHDVHRQLRLLLNVRAVMTADQLLAAEVPESSVLRYTRGSQRLAVFLFVATVVGFVGCISIIGWAAL